MKTALVIGDVHAEHHLLKRALEYGESLGITDVLCCGDFCDGYGDVEACIALARRHGIHAVSGNHDEWCMQNTMRTLKDATPFASLSPDAQAYLKRLKPVEYLDTAAGTLILCHGLMHHNMAKVGADDFGYALENNFELHEFLNQRTARLMVNGHTHRRMIRAFGDKTILNAGTLFRDHQPCFGVADFVQCTMTYLLMTPEGDIVDKDVIAF